jgi:hypothetical protein
MQPFSIQTSNGQIDDLASSPSDPLQSLSSEGWLVLEKTFNSALSNLWLPYDLSAEIRFCSLRRRETSEDDHFLYPSLGQSRDLHTFLWKAPNADNWSICWLRTSASRDRGRERETK